MSQLEFLLARRRPAYQAKDPPFFRHSPGVSCLWFLVLCVVWCDLDLVTSGMVWGWNGMVWGSGGCVWSLGLSGHTVTSQLAQMSELLRREFA